MTAPVTPTAPAVRTPSTNAAGGRAGAGPSPFASMLDDALSADRPAASERGLERRSSPDERAARAADRAADKAERTADRTAEHAADRADRADRAAERALRRTAQHAAHRADRAAGAANDATDTPSDADAVEGDADATVGDVAGSGPDRTGLPANLWALVMSGAMSPAVQAPATVTGETAVESPAVTGTVPAPAVAPGVEAAPGVEVAPGVAAVDPLVPVALASCWTLLNVKLPSAPFCRQPVMVMSPAAAAAVVCVGFAD